MAHRSASSDLREGLKVCYEEFILDGDGASRAEPRSGAHAAGIDGAKGNWLPRDGWFALLRRASRA